MTAGISADQQALVDLADQVLRGRTSNEQLAAVEQAATRVDDRLWAELAEAGLVGIGLPEQYGGAGLGLPEVCLLLEQQGRRLAPIPLWETATAALAIARFGTEEQRGRWLPGVADGTCRLSLALDAVVSCSDGKLSGQAHLVPQAHVADALVVVVGESLAVLPTTQLERVDVVTSNHTVASDVTFADAPAEPLGESSAAQWLIDRAHIGLAALVLGVADAGVREAAAYLSGREQFGRAIATFQAVTQQLGDAYCDVQAMRATLWQAVWLLEQGAEARSAVDVALWWATDGGGRVQHAVQHLHGGMGADTTYPVHRRLLWTMRASAQLGGPSRQLASLGAALVRSP